MMNDTIRSVHGVYLLNLNWGYQVCHGNEVLAAITDTQGGPRRSEECNRESLRRYERLCGLYERLYRWRKPTQRQLTLLAHIVRGDVTDERHHYGKPDGRVAESLIDRGIIRRVNRSLRYKSYKDFEPVFNDGGGQL